MLIHYYTLVKLSDELGCLLNMSADSCYTQENDSLIIEFAAENTNLALQINLGAKFSSLFLRENFARARKNTTDLFHGLPGQVLLDVYLYPGNRILRLSFSKNIVYIFLFGMSQSNFIVTDKSNKIIGSFYDNDDLEKRKTLQIPDSKLKEIDDFSDTDKISDILNKSVLQLGPHYSRELLTDKNISPQSLKSDLSTELFTELILDAIKLRERCLRSDKFYLLQHSDRVLFSLIKLKDCEIIDEYDSLSHALRRKYALQIKQSSFSPAEKKLRKQLQRLNKKFAKDIAFIEDEESVATRAAKYTLSADLLASQPEPHKKYGSKIIVDDWNGVPQEIALDPKLNLLQNSEAYYKKARNTRENHKHKLKNLNKLKNQLLLTRQSLEKLDSADTVKDIDQIKLNVKSLPGIVMEEFNQTPESKYRTFDIGEGLTLYVGKNAKNNDELTMRFAKPNDLWLHARGASGSHGVIPLEKNQRPGKHTLSKAASIIAYYSHAKNAKYVPVAYTYKKYVRKPKGANPGSVVIAREEVIMAEPGLPKNE